MSPTIQADDRCCDKCDTPRTLLQFQENHLKPLHGPLEENATCAICHEPYGTEHLSALMRDDPVVVVGVPHCNHTFGAACIDRLRWTAKGETTTQCPLCRTPWWFNRARIETEVDRHRVSEYWANVYQCDYNTVRWSISSEPEYAVRYLPIALEEVEYKDALYGNIGIALQLPVIEELLTKLQEESSIFKISDAVFDPSHLIKQRFSTIDVFKFNNYHIDLVPLAAAIYLTLFSWRGMRLLELYCSKSAEAPLEKERAATEKIVRSWMEVFPDDEENWVDFVVRVLWYADPERTFDDRDAGDAGAGNDNRVLDGEQAEAEVIGEGSRCFPV